MSARCHCGSAAHKPVAAYGAWCCPEALGQSVTIKVQVADWDRSFVIEERADSIGPWFALTSCTGRQVIAWSLIAEELRAWALEQGAKRVEVLR